MSLSAWNGTVVPRPSEWRYWRCEPLWRTSENPKASRNAATSRGFRTGIEPTYATLMV